MMLYQILVFTIHGKLQRAHTKTTDLEYQLQLGIINLKCLMDRILIQDYFEYVIRKYETLTDNPPIRIYVN